MCETSSVSKSDALIAALELESNPNILSAVAVQSSETWIVSVKAKDPHVDIPTSIQVGQDSENNPIYVQIQQSQ